MIKFRLGLALVGCLAMPVPAAANNPFVGDWKLNPSKSTIKDTMTVQSIGGNKYTFDFGGGPEAIVVDGTDQPSNRYGGSSLSVAIEGDTWKVVRKSNGRAMLSAIWNISGDGRTLTDRYTGFGDEGARYDIVYTYRRKESGSGFAGTWISTDEVAVNFVLQLQIRPFEVNGLSIIDPSSQIMGNRDFAAPLVRKVNERTLDLLRKKSDGDASVALELRLSQDSRTLTIGPASAPGRESRFLAFDRQ